jgi:hypothetical protein
MKIVSFEASALSTGIGMWEKVENSLGFKWKTFFPKDVFKNYYVDHENLSDFQNALKNIFILFIGDSVDFAMFSHACSALNGKIEQHIPLFGYNYCRGSQGAILIHTLICGSHEGPYFKDCKSRFHGKDWNLKASDHIEQMGSELARYVGKSPEIISVHFGIWDLATKWQYGAKEKFDAWFDGYPLEWMFSAKTSLKQISNEFPNSMIIFRIIGPTVVEQFKNPVLEDRLDMRFVSAIAHSTKELCVRENFLFVDFFSMMHGMDKFCLDGLHWDGEIMVAGVLNSILNLYYNKY